MLVLFGKTKDIFKLELTISSCLFGNVLSAYSDCNTPRKQYYYSNSGMTIMSCDLSYKRIALSRDGRDLGLDWVVR